MITINKHRSKLKNWSVKMPNTPYSDRYGQVEKHNMKPQIRKPPKINFDIA